MNRQELVELIAAETGDTKASTERHLDAFIKAVTETLAAGERLSLAGFGHFHATLVRRRVGWNPNAGTSVNYPPTLRVNFKPGSKLKAALGAAAEAMDTPTASPDSPPPSLIPEDQRADFLAWAREGGYDESYFNRWDSKSRQLEEDYLEARKHDHGESR
ncbi:MULTISPECIES: HU family DNA-binding protein [Xanthomonas]|jgi:DNA-binding protein HU-beta|uniref:DNA-binding protein HU-beta (Modular protein) n=3 Tax=Xanthomonas TaxID=338 RepID=A0A7Z7J0Q9_XANCH|nr:MULTISPECIES: HU family DNA-binding protein [Xanthomonas]ATS86760.1 HU family DNA-binding protein [Xanthomonas citri pv. phaseoli var. fuscans]WOP59082.1 HU family DNA-binding protein [Xanthomonas euvesicatoria]SOO23708.1 DNA-binding protein HU-beta (modular protein) [Xanthomonas phaseoli pv. phaseoli]